MELLPKLLQTVLSQLLDEKDLNQWNMQCNGDTVYVNLRFTQHGQCAGSNSPFMPGWRPKSPSEKRRDAERLSSWQNRRDSNSSVKNAEENGNIDSSGVGTFVPNYSGQSKNSTAHVGHGQPATSQTVDSTDSDDLCDPVPDHNTTKQSADSLSTNPVMGATCTPKQSFPRQRKETLNKMNVLQSDYNYNVIDSQSEEQDSCDDIILQEQFSSTYHSVKQCHVDMDTLD